VRRDLRRLQCLRAQLLLRLLFPRNRPDNQRPQNRQPRPRQRLQDPLLRRLGRPPRLQHIRYIRLLFRNNGRRQRLLRELLLKRNNRRAQALPRQDLEPYLRGQWADHRPAASGRQSVPASRLAAVLVRRKECARLLRPANHVPAGLRALGRRLLEDFRSGLAPDARGKVPLDHVLVVRVLEGRGLDRADRAVLLEYRKRNRVSRSTRANLPPHVDGRLSKSDSPKASAGCTPFGRDLAQVEREELLKRSPSLPFSASRVK
jgi:hypothetical protein